jgi:hypothetical protein
MRIRSVPLPRLLAATAALVLALAIVGGCRPRSRTLQPGLYRAVVELPGGEVPFGLDVVREKSSVALYLVNGKDRVRVPVMNAVR